VVNIGLSAEIRSKVVDRLRYLLANEYVLYTKTLKFHWNVKGPFFDALHKLFNDHYEQLLIFADDVAERCRALGADSSGTLKEFLEQTTLKEHPGKNPSYEKMIAQLLADHETIIRQIRVDADDTQEWGDMGTNNFLLNMLEKHEKMAWMLRAHLE